jgi:6-phosphogluconolactonase
MAVETFPDPLALAQAAAERLLALSTDAIATAGRFSLGLSGGSTPRTLFELLASSAFASQIEWPRVHLFWGDERCVPPDHADSNYRMTRQVLLDRIPVPAENIHRICGELSPTEAAVEYERDLKTYFGSDALPRFDMLLLGMGTDGHTASLFPGTSALREDSCWVVENYVAQMDAWRITLTAPAINAAANVCLLVAGAEKAETLRHVLQGPHQPEIYPAQLVRPKNGRLTWMVDAAAAARLTV